MHTFGISLRIFKGKGILIRQVHLRLDVKNDNYFGFILKSVLLAYFCA